ncbi:MAG: hypothetical protein SAJ72_08270 [Jaaginema sp. PMC 1080.18]|nr:hypothetical protein [Jaaginema sp. PMC 1080.18]MEC4864738.1 hypothetical protein [Jaaginema sp. PMC 1078.18]
MAGFFGLFGGKNKDEAYFLGEDDSKTLGNLDYMRTPNKSRRTFPKTLKNPNGFEINNEISAMTIREITENGVTKPKTTNQPSSSFSSNNNSRSSDKNLDMWRSMAKDMRK